MNGYDLHAEMIVVLSRENPLTGIGTIPLPSTQCSPKYLFSPSVLYPFPPTHLLLHRHSVILLVVQHGFLPLIHMHNILGPLPISLPFLPYLLLKFKNL